MLWRSMPPPYASPTSCSWFLSNRWQGRAGRVRTACDPATPDLSYRILKAIDERETHWIKLLVRTLQFVMVAQLESLLFFARHLHRPKHLSPAKYSVAAQGYLGIEPNFTVYGPPSPTTSCADDRPKPWWHRLQMILGANRTVYLERVPRYAAFRINSSRLEEA